MQSTSRLQVIHLAWPIVLSNLSTPLLGLVDTAVIGNMGNVALIGAIALGALIFSFLYWGFGFLRMGTTGLVAQARGAGDQIEVKAAFYRALAVGLAIGCLLLLLQGTLGQLAFGLLDGSEQVETAALTYFQIRIWVAPISLAHLAIIGFLLGQQDTRSVLLIQLVLNSVNILLDIIFVVGFEWGVMGVATATVISEVLAFILGTVIVVRSIRRNSQQLPIPMSTFLDPSALKRMLVVNRDIMIRTLCLLFAFAWFTNQGAQAGDIILSTNAILMQFVSFAAFFLDGFALAAETLVGHAIGAKNQRLLDQAIRFSFEIAALTSCLLAVLFWIFGSTIINVMTNIESVRQTAEEYFVWVILAPVLSFACYLLDGIFIGATKTAEMRNAMLVSLIAFLLAWYLLYEPFGNHGLWAALQIYFLARAISLAYYLPGLRKLD